MEPEIRLAPNEVVQMEGWLLKRKVGFESEAEDSFNSEASEQLPTQIAPTGSKLEALLLRKTERKRYFVLTTQRGDSKTPPRACLTYCSKKPAFVKEEAAANNLGQLAKKAFQHEVNSQFVRGQIELTDTTEIQLLDTTEIVIVVPGKTYYFRPLQKGKNLAEAKIQAGQWYTAIRRAIKDVWQMQMNRRSGEQTSLRRSNDTRLEDCPEDLQGVLDSPLHRKNFRLFCEFCHASENMAFYEQVEEYEAKYSAVAGSGQKRSSGIAASLSARLSKKRNSRLKVPKDLIYLGKEIVEQHVREGSAKQVNLSDGNRTHIIELVSKQGDKAFTPDLFAKAKQEIFQLMETNFFMRFHREEMRKTGCFSKLYGKNGMRGYELVLGHFGKVKTDLDRLLHLYDLRLAQVDAQVKVLREALHISHDVALPSFKTTRDAVVQLFRNNAVYLQTLTEFKTQLNEHVHFPLTWLKRSIEIQLESIINGVQHQSDALEDAKTNVERAKERLYDLQTLKQMSTVEDFPNEEALELLRKLNIDHTDVIAAMEEMDQVIYQNEMTQTRLTKELEDTVIDSLDKLESLEHHRIESQQRAIRHAVEAEKAFFQVLRRESLSTAAAASKIDPPSDIESFVNIFTQRLEESESTVS